MRDNELDSERLGQVFADTEYFTMYGKVIEVLTRRDTCLTKVRVSREELFISLKEAGVRPDIITFLRHELKRVKQEKKESYQSRKEALCATS